MSKLFIAVVIIFLTIGSFAQTPRSARDFSERGRERYARGDYDGAIADFTQAIDLTSRLEINDRPARNNLTVHQQSFDEAATARVHSA